MKFVKSILKVLPEIMVLLSSMSYIIIRLVADINKVSLPTWLDSFNIPTVALFMMVFILLYRSKEKKNGEIWGSRRSIGNRCLIVTNQKRSNDESWLRTVLSILTRNRLYQRWLRNSRDIKNWIGCRKGYYQWFICPKLA